MLFRSGHPLNAAGTTEFSGWDIWQYAGSPIDHDRLNFASPLAALLRRGYVTQATLDSAVVQKQIELAAATTALNAQIAALSDALNGAAIVERERIAVVLGQAEADRVRTV